MFPSVKGLLNCLLIDLFINIMQFIFIMNHLLRLVHTINQVFQFLKFSKIFLISLISRAACSISNKVILPSENAYNTIKRKKNLKKKLLR